MKCASRCLYATAQPVSANGGNPSQQDLTSESQQPCSLPHPAASLPGGKKHGTGRRERSRGRPHHLGTDVAPDGFQSVSRACYGALREQGKGVQGMPCPHPCICQLLTEGCVTNSPQTHCCSRAVHFLLVCWLHRASPSRLDSALSCRLGPSAHPPVLASQACPSPVLLVAGMSGESRSL